MNAPTNATSLANPSVLPSPIPEAWVEKLFSRFSAMYGRKFADLWSDCNLANVKALWAEELGILTRDELASGVAACKIREWPPTLPEFLRLCRPEPDFDALFAGAANSASTGDWKGNRLAFWAAQSVGAFDVRNEPYYRMEARWKKAVTELLADGELPEIPPRQEALPAPGQQSITKEEAAKIVKAFGFKQEQRSDQKAWARKIMESPAVYPAISVLFAQKSLESAA